MPNIAIALPPVKPVKRLENGDPDTSAPPQNPRYGLIQNVRVGYDPAMRVLALLAVALLSCPRLWAQLSGIYVPPHDIDAGTDPQGEVLTPMALTRPAVGGVVTDMVFNTEIRRMPDNHTHVYSQLQAFSHDSSRVIMVDHNQAPCTRWNLPVS
jgi:hypothetical protein